MQRHSRDRDRDDESARGERGSQARNEGRYPQALSRDARGEFGRRREPDQERSSSYDASFGSSPASGRWREARGERERFEQSYGRGGQPSDYYSGGSLSGGPQRDDDYRSSWNEPGEPPAWRPGSSASTGGQRRPLDSPLDSPQYSQYGETEYGIYGPRHGSSGAQSTHGAGGSAGSQLWGNAGSRYGRSGEERADDRWLRDGYGQSRWTNEHEGSLHQMDPDYRQWREEQIRNLDADYQRYRQERYRKFADEFGTWRKNRESPGAQSTQGADSWSGARSGMGQAGMGQGDMAHAGSGNQSGIGSSGGQTSTPMTGTPATSSPETSPKDSTIVARDPLRAAKTDRS